jgi:hypothetical protein
LQRIFIPDRNLKREQRSGTGNTVTVPDGAKKRVCLEFFKQTLNHFDFTLYRGARRMVVPCNEFAEDRMHLGQARINSTCLPAFATLESVDGQIIGWKFSTVDKVRTKGSNL